MTNEILSANELLAGTGISILNSARLIRNILDAKGKASKLSDLQFCSCIIETGKRHIRQKEMSMKNGFALYLKNKTHLRPESLRDMKYLGTRLLKSSPKFSNTNISELTLQDCENWLLSTFTTPSQFNKARTMLHGFFEFSIRREICDKNPVKLIEKQRVVEKEINPLSLLEIKRIIKTALQKNRDCTAAVGLLMLAGIRPQEVRRLRWKDIDLEENTITVRSQCSKTGGVRQVEICPALKSLLAANKKEPDSHICPPNWNRKWKKIRDSSGFRGLWIQDVLRHTFASYHAKRFADLSRLQLNMGHRDQSLLRSRYVNMRGISKSDAINFFNLKKN